MFIVTSLPEQHDAEGGGGKLVPMMLRLFQDGSALAITASKINLYLYCPDVRRSDGPLRYGVRRASTPEKASYIPYEAGTLPYMVIERDLGDRGHRLTSGGYNIANKLEFVTQRFIRGLLYTHWH